MVLKKPVQLEQQNNTFIQEKQYVITIPDTPSLDMVYFYLRFFNIQHPEVVWCQSYLETNKLTQINNKNNLFNFRYSKRYSVGIKENKSKYTEYKHWIHSIIEYRNWQRRKYKDTTENYYHFLKRVGFAEDTLYNHKLKFILKRNKLRLDTLETKYLLVKNSIILLE